MNDMPKAPDFMELLMESIVTRIKAAVMKDVAAMIQEALAKVDAEDIQGLEQFVDKCFEEHARNIDAEDVEGLDKAIKDVIKNASINLDISF